MRVRVRTLGCKVNQYESSALEEALEARGCLIAGKGEEADVVVINTCTVTQRSDRNARAMIRRARRELPKAKLVVTGCFAELEREEALRLGADQVVGTGDKQRLAELILLDEGAETAKTPLSSIAPLTLAPEPVHRFGERARAFFKVQDGCEAFCSYCIVPHARGPSRSLPPDEVAAGLARLREGGHREVVLTGIHLGYWGRELEPPRPFSELIDLAEGSGVDRVRLSSLEPLELTDELIERIAASDTLCPHLHIPLQSGSDPVLARMERPYTAAQFAEAVERAFVQIDGLCLGLDVIVGFPGETEGDFEVTYTLLERLPFCYLHVFPYSRRKKTPAAEMADQIGEPVKRERAARLRKLSARKREAFYKEQLCKTLPALAEGDVSAGRLKLRTRNYVEVVVDWVGPPPEGEVGVLLLQYGDETVEGRIVGDRGTGGGR